MTDVFKSLAYVPWCLNIRSCDFFFSGLNDIEKLKCGATLSTINPIWCLQHCPHPLVLTCLLKLQFLFISINLFFSLYSKKSFRTLICLCPLSVGHAHFHQNSLLLLLWSTQTFLSVLHNTTISFENVRSDILRELLIALSSALQKWLISYKGSILFKIYI